MIVIFKKTTTLSSWACRKISVLLFLDRAPMGSGGKGGSGGCLSCGGLLIFTCLSINMPLWTDLLIFRRQARERHLARLTHGTTFDSCHSSPRTLLFLNVLLSLPGEIHSCNLGRYLINITYLMLVIKHSQCKKHDVPYSKQ